MTLPVIQADPGGEVYIGFAKMKLAQWKAEMRRRGLRILHKVIQVSDGATIYVESLYLGGGQFRDRIRISAGAALYGADPFHPLWNIASALMPGTREGVDPALSWTHTVQHTTSFFPNPDGTYLRRHWVVICRYCQRVAEYTWDEARVAGVEPGTFVTTAAYVSHDTDGTLVSVRDTAEDGTTADYDLAISPSLKALSDANDWGWIDQGESAEHPGTEPPEEGSITVVDISITNDEPVIGYYASGGNFPIYTSRTYHAEFSDGYEFTYTLPGNVSDNNPFQSTFTPGNQIGEHLGLPLYNSVVFVLAPAEVYDAAVAAGFTGPYQAELAARNAALAPAHDSWCQRAIDCAQHIIGQIATMMYDKKIGAVDLTELRPYDGAISHRAVRGAVLINAVSSAQLTFTCDDLSEAYEYASVVPVPAADIYGVSIGLSDPAVPPPPGTPWAVSVADLTAILYRPAAQDFGPPAAGPAFRHAAFSKGVAGAPQYGQTQALPPSGFYRVAAAPSAEFDPVLPAALDALMERLCVGSLTQDELEFVIYHSITPGSQAAAALAYREVEHAHTSGAYSFAQPAIPPP